MTIHVIDEKKARGAMDEFFETTVVPESVEKGYAPGKNPNSHKKGALSNRRANAYTEVTPRDQKASPSQLGLAIIGDAKRELRLARKAKTKGDLGKASFHARRARVQLRTARKSKVGDRGLTVTYGSKAHEESTLWNASRRMTMREARWNKARGDKKATSESVARARDENRSVVEWRNRSRMNKGYAVGKNPASHQRRRRIQDKLNNMWERIGHSKDRPTPELRAKAHTARKHLFQASEFMAVNNPKAIGHYKKARRVISTMPDVAQILAKSMTFDEIQKARAKSQYGIGKHPNSHKGKGKAAPMTIGDGGLTSSGEYVSAKLPKKKSSFDGGLGGGRRVKTGADSAGAKAYASGVDRGIAARARYDASKLPAVQQNSSGPKKAAYKESKLKQGGLPGAAAKKIAMAREALRSGNKGAASAYARDARESFRIMGSNRKRPSIGGHLHMSGVPQTEGGKAFLNYEYDNRAAKSSMAAARRLKEYGNPADLPRIQREVRAARGANRRARINLHRSRTTKSEPVFFDEIIEKWDASKHPRRKDGKFGTGSGGTAVLSGGTSRRAKFGSGTIMAPAGAADSPKELRAAARAYKRGGMAAAGAILDKRQQPADQHAAELGVLMGTVGGHHGMTMADALKNADARPQTVHSMSMARRRKGAQMVRDHMKEQIAKLGGKVAKGRRVHIIMGLPGSGKSELEKVIGAREKAITIDSDNFKEKLKGFDGGLGAAAVHEESALLANVMQKAATKAGANMILPLVGKSPGPLIAKIKRMKKLGYKVIVHHVDVPNEFAQTRVVQRYLAKGRAVSPGYVKAIKNGVNKKGEPTYDTRTSFDMVVKSGAVDGHGAVSAHNIPGNPIRYAVLGSRGYRYPKR